jgi:hypothetical protein
MDDQENLLTRRKILLTGTGLAAAGAAGALTIGQSLSPALAAGSSARSTESNLPVKAIEDVFGVKGTIEPSGVLLIDLSREDLHPTIFGVPIKPDAGFDTEITFQAISQGAIVKWEFCLLDKEVNPVLDALFAQDLQPRTTNLNALHNHFLEVKPEVKFLHGTAIGDPVHIAKALRNALEHSHQPFVSSPPGNTHLPNEEITQIVGGTSMISDSVLTVSVDRKDRFRELGILLKPDMQVDSMINFQSIGNGLAAVVLEIPVLPEEADAVARTLRQHNIYVTALHNHELFIEPDLYYLHGFGTGGPLELARSVRAALNHTDSEFKS